MRFNIMKRQELWPDGQVDGPADFLNADNEEAERRKLDYIEARRGLWTSASYVGRTETLLMREFRLRTPSPTP